MVSGPGLKQCLPETGMILKQETVITPLNLNARIRAFWDGLYFHPSCKLGLTMTAAVLSIGQNGLLVLYLCNPTLYSWEWIERKALAKPLCCCQQSELALLLNLTLLPNMQRLVLKSIDNTKKEK